MSNDRLLTIALESAKKAGVEVMSYYRKGNYTAQMKEDNSPVTSADLAANTVLMDNLKTLTPEIPIISEEVGNVPWQERKHWERYWLLDPIDGTGEFIIGSGDFAVNIALVERGWPTLGVIHAPDHCLTYYARDNLGAFKETGQASHQIKVAKYHQDKAIKVAISRRQELNLMGQYLNPDYDFEYVALGSCSLKNCLIAEGGADCYLRIGPTGEWDTGASHCILDEAGGDISDLSLNRLTYNQRDTLANPNFVVTGDPGLAWREIIIPTK